MSLVEKALHKLRPATSRNAEAPTAARPARQPNGELLPLNSVIWNRPALRAAGLLSPESQEWRIAADYRRIKPPLLAKALGRGGADVVPDGHLLMVCSALPGEGKTFTSVNLALSLAQETDFTTVLVDADLAKPNISRVLGLEGRPGLTDVLQDSSLAIESVLYATDVDRLLVLPAGIAAPNATELLSGTRMHQILELLGSRRLVVFDTSPLLLTSEPQALAASVGQVVMVIQAQTTQQQAVRDAIALVGNAGKVSLVLNQSDDAAAKGDSRYGYYGQPSAGSDNNTQA